jgi:hypothetical protein
MANQREVIWTGASGKQYKYWVYPRHSSIKEGSLGNYIYAKVVCSTSQMHWEGQTHGEVAPEAGHTGYR